VSRTESGTTINAVWDIAQPNPLMLQEGQNTYLYGLGLISKADATGERQYDHTDALGSTRAVTDASGATVVKYEYDAFGALRNQTGIASGVFRFTGEQLDTTGLYFLRARYYDPAPDRFLSRDPFPGYSEDPRTLNPYTYAGNVRSGSWGEGTGAGNAQRGAVAVAQHVWPGWAEQAVGRIRGTTAAVR